MAKAQERQLYVSAGIKSPLAVRTEMLEAGEMSQDVFNLMEEEDESKLEMNQNGGINGRGRPQTQQDDDSPTGDVDGPKVMDMSPPTRDRFGTRVSTDTDADTDVGADAKGQVRGMKADVLGDFDDVLAGRLCRRLEDRLYQDMSSALKKAWAVLRDRIEADAGVEPGAPSPSPMEVKTLKWLFGRRSVINLPDDPRLWERLRVILQLVIVRHTAEIAAESIRFNIGLGLAVDLNFVDDSILEFTRQYSNEWWNSLSTTTREGLRDALTTWQESGLGKRGMPDLVKSLESVFFSKVRAHRIAATEVTRIFDQGNRIAERSAGVEFQRWHTAVDEKVCPICSPLDMQVFPIDGGPRPVTDTHIQCRCRRRGISRMAAEASGLMAPSLS